MYSAIVTKYLGPTNYRGSRIKATCPETKQSITIPYEPEFDSFPNHENSAKTLLGMMKINQSVKFYAGALDTGYVFVIYPVTEKR